MQKELCVPSFRMCLSEKWQHSQVSACGLCVCVCECVCICMHIWHHSGKFHDKFCVLQSCHFHVCLQIQRSPSLGRSRVITHFLFRSARCYGHWLHDNSLLFLRHL